jgi:hypothetical protein
MTKFKSNKNLWVKYDFSPFINMFFFFGQIEKTKRVKKGQEDGRMSLGNAFGLVSVSGLFSLMCIDP